MVVKPPDGRWVVRWVVGVVLNVQSTSAGCAEKGVFGAKWTTFRAEVRDSGGLGPSGGWDRGESMQGAKRRDPAGSGVFNCLCIRHFV